LKNLQVLIYSKLLLGNNMHLDNDVGFSFNFLHCLG